MRGRVVIPQVAYPLTWPSGVARTRSPVDANFAQHKSESYETKDWQTGQTVTRERKHRQRVTVATARDEVLAELQRLGAGAPVIISTNIRTKLDGLPYSNAAEPIDSGVAVYFALKKTETCIAIDRYHRVADNLRAIAKTIEALRGIERWGGAQLLHAAFTGFQGLPAPGESSMPSWWTALGVAEDAPIGEIETVARRLSAESHPDRGGDAERFKEVRAALEAARASRSVPA